MKDVPPNICYRLTKKCNLKCSFCLAENGTSTDMEFNHVKQTVLKLRDGGMQSIRLSGGEPTLRPDLIEIIKYCQELGVEIILCSNLFDVENILDDLIDLQISVTTSIHGDRHSHNATTGLQAYEKTVANINRIVREGMAVNIHFIVTKSNFHYLDNIMVDSISWGAKKISFIPFIPRGRGIHCRNLFELSTEDVNHVLFKTERYVEKYGKQIKIKFNNFLEKDYYVFEPDGYLYLQTPNNENVVVGRIE